MMEFPAVMEVRMKVRVFWGNYLNKIVKRYEIGRLLNEESLQFEVV